MILCSFVPLSLCSAAIQWFCNCSVNTEHVLYTELDGSTAIVHLFSPSSSSSPSSLRRCRNHSYVDTGWPGYTIAIIGLSGHYLTIIDLYWPLLTIIGYQVVRL